LPQVQPFISIFPSEFAIVTSATLNSVTLAITIPFGTQPQIVKGVLQIKVGKSTTPLPLPIELDLQESPRLGSGLLEGGFIPPVGEDSTSTLQYATEDGANLELEVLTGKVHVLFDSAVNLQSARNIMTSEGGLIIGAVPKIGLYLINVGQSDERSFIERMREHELVSHVWPAQPITPDSISVPTELNDPNLAAGTWYLDSINARPAWRIASNSSLDDIEVGLVDTDFRGLDQGLADFGARLQNLPGETGVTPYHGTANSAICCSQGDNGFGNVGVNWWPRVRGYTANGATVSITRWIRATLSNSTGFIAN
jgi:hypothetical protein